MEDARAWLTVATDECETLDKYSLLLETVKDKDQLKEIMGDEFNHALIALFTAAKLLDIKIAADGIEAAMDGVRFEGDDGNAD